MSIPFRFAVSEKPLTILPVAGQIQSILSSSISGTWPVSARGAGTGAAATFGAGTGGAGSGGGVARVSCRATVGGAETGDACWSCAKACSEYGSFTARGSVLNDALFPRPEPGWSEVGGRISEPLGVTGGVVTRGAVTAPPGAPG